MNEAATAHGVGLHARLAVQSALAVGGLEPVLLYLGARNEYTAWLEAQGVRVIDTEPRFAPVLRAEASAGRGTLDHLGHWLRTCIPLLETEREFVLYTDCDVVFLRRPALDDVRPPFIACAPEFRADDWRYFNSGVVLMNVAALRAGYEDFEAFVIDGIRAASGREFLDQNAYNAYYGRRWSRLDPRYNWKTYWPPDPATGILHFHGPKIDVALRIMQGGWDWEAPHGRQLGSLLLANLDSYTAHLRAVLALLPDMFGHARGLIEAVLSEAPRFAVEGPREKIDLGFTK